MSWYYRFFNFFIPGFADDLFQFFHRSSTDEMEPEYNLAESVYYIMLCDSDSKQDRISLVQDCVFYFRCVPCSPLNFATGFQYCIYSPCTYSFNKEFCPGWFWMEPAFIKITFNKNLTLLNTTLEFHRLLLWTEFRLVIRNDYWYMFYYICYLNF